MVLSLGSESVNRSVVSDSVTPWTVAQQVPLSMGFSRQEYWSGLPCPSPGDLSNPGIEPGSPALQADSLLSEPPGIPITRVMLESCPHTLALEPSEVLLVSVWTLQGELGLQSHVEGSAGRGTAGAEGR